MSLLKPSSSKKGSTTRLRLQSSKKNIDKFKEPIEKPKNKHDIASHEM